MTRRMTLRAVAVALVAGAALPAAAQSVPDRLDDLRLATAVRLALVADALTRPLDATVEARDGRVRLDVDAADRAPAVARVVQAVPGVRAVEGLRLDAAPPTSTVSIRTPEALPAESATGPLRHTVRRGDTLFGIARRYGTTVEAILRLNDRRSTSIRVGERLRVR